VTTVLSVGLGGQGIVFMAAVAAGLFLPTVTLTAVLWFTDLFGPQTGQPGSTTEDDDDDDGFETGSPEATDDEEDAGGIGRDSGDSLPQREGDSSDTATQGGFAVDGWGEHNDAAAGPDQSAESAASSGVDLGQSQSAASGNQNDSSPADAPSDANTVQEQNQGRNRQQDQSRGRADSRDEPAVDPEMLESSRDSPANDNDGESPEDDGEDGLQESDVKYQQRRSPY